MGEMDLVLVFGTVQKVMEAEKALASRGLEVDVVPAPRAVSSDCGVVLEARREDATAISEVLEREGLEPEACYRRTKAGWMLTALASVSVPDVRLAADTAYGGCGAKLAKGTLSTILCGLPRLEDERLIVGIEFADDAGVVKVGEDLAVIHTADFFPPMVDDPYSFGRIAATNALSDVYAMGGKPLAGMNLVSFPAGKYSKEILKEVLRGGLDALREAGAVLAGGHTLESSELLYGMAVTGTVHPESVWRNSGARAGDLLVLTKPLGTGVVTTGAKAGEATAEELGTAVRWMATLNAKAAAAAKRVAPRAVTDVTGFGLIGHAAEIALASGLGVELWLEEMPLLPGAKRLAAMGMVPAGAGKNAESMGDALQVPEGVDPVLLDLALDPQTSGGLLVAADPYGAEELVRMLPEAKVVGRCIEAEPGTVVVLQRRGISGPQDGTG